MKASAAEKRFKKADDLFRAGDYEAALSMLRELDASFPNTPRLLFPIALCLEKLEQETAALEICDHLINVLEYEKTIPVRDRIIKQQAIARSGSRPSPWNDGDESEFEG